MRARCIAKFGGADPLVCAGPPGPALVVEPPAKRQRADRGAAASTDNFMAERKSFLMRIDPALWAELEAWAQDELRSVNGQIEYLLRQAVHKRKGGTETHPAEPDKP
jgi:hypothetical protein